MRDIITRFLRDTAGATAIEYGLIAALIGIGLIAGATALGGGINGMFQGLADDEVKYGG